MLINTKSFLGGLKINSTGTILCFSYQFHNLSHIYRFPCKKLHLIQSARMLVVITNHIVRAFFNSLLNYFFLYKIKLTTLTSEGIATTKRDK